MKHIWNVNAHIRFNNLGTMQRLSLIWAILHGWSATFVMPNATIDFGDETLQDSK